MCGICGIAMFDGSRVDEGALLAMREALHHRGPDSGGMLLDGSAGIAARRLSIIDLARGDQPIANEDSTVHVVQNGEIYNFAELREGLARKGHAFRTRSDTEVLVHLYEEHGPGFVRALRGMFALAVWDAPRRRLLLARDRFGIKPLYYAASENGLSFASELKSLVLAPGFVREIDGDALTAYLAFNSVPAPFSIFSAARKLPAGHVLVADLAAGLQGISLERFARPAPAPAEGLRREDEAELAEELRSRLRDSVRAHLVADVPVGVLLSGGVDSATLVALAAAESRDPVKTFTIGFEEASFDEREVARAVAERYGTEHHELVLRPDGAELLEDLAGVFDEPLGDSSAIPTYLVSKLAAPNVKVALSGEGGDELFGGYFTYVADSLAAHVGSLAPLVRPLVERLPSSTHRVSLDYKAKRFVRAAHLPPLERHHGWKEIFSPEERLALLGPRRTSEFDPFDLLRARYAETEGAQQLARLQDVDLGTYLVDDLLVKTDRASMAHSLEVRVPFLDTVVTELAFSLPDSLKVRRLQKKRLLRRAVAPLLPKTVIDGPKRGFSIPAAAWLRGDLLPFAREVLAAERTARQGCFDPAVVTEVLESHVSGRADLSRQLWGLMAFSLWHDRFG